MVICCFVFLFFGFYFWCSEYFEFAPTVNNKNLKFLTKKSFLNSIAEVFFPLVVPFIKLSDTRMRELNIALEDGKINYTPQQYVARAIIIAVLLLCFIPICFMVGFPIVSPIILAMAAYIFFRLYNEVNEQTKANREAMNRAMPSFARAILYKVKEESSTTMQVDLIGVFEDYLKVADEAFVYDISRLVSDMKITGDITGALKAFEAKVALPDLSLLIGALIGVADGENQQEALGFLSRDMDIKAREYIKMELQKRPAKVKRATIPLAVLAVLSILYVLGNHLLNSISAF